MGYWDNPEIYKKRNLEIIKDKKKGLSILQMSIKYNLSGARILAIIHRDKLKKQKGGKMTIEEKAKEKAEEMRQEVIPEAVASVTFNVIDPNGFPALVTVREVSSAKLFDRIEGVSAFMKDAGYSPDIRKSGGGKPKEYVDGTCPKCNSKLVKFTTKTGKSGVQCENRKYDFLTKTTTGCDYIKWDDEVEHESQVESATPKQIDLLKSKNLWEEGMTKARATELISMVLGK